MVPTAINYDASAAVHDGSCLFAIRGCTNQSQLNFNPLASVDDGSCRHVRRGCAHHRALNFDVKANLDDGSCHYVRKGCTQRAGVNFDPTATRDDGSCIVASVGCLSPLAVNYDSRARVDSGACKYAVSGCTDSRALNYLSLATLSSGICILPKHGCMARNAINYESSATLHTPPTCVYPDPTEGATSSLVANVRNVRGCVLSEAANYNSLASIDDGSCAFAWQEPSLRQNRQHGGGCMDPLANNFMSSAQVHDGKCLYAPALGCTDPSANNYNRLASVDDGSCRWPRPGCLSSLASGYNATATDHVPSACGSFAVRGCTDPSAVNFDVKAQVDSGACIPRRVGCTDQRASNFDAIANTLARRGPGACTYALRGCTANGALYRRKGAIEDDGSCRFAACTDLSAVNFVSGAHVADVKSCVYARRGCMDQTAPNFDAHAVTDDGSCAFLGCTRKGASNYNASVTADDGSCIPPRHGPRHGGCTVDEAHNYDSLADYDDGSCVRASHGCTIRGAVNFSPHADVDDGSCRVLGCTRRNATNHNALANVDDGSCRWPSPKALPSPEVAIRRMCATVIGVWGAAMAPVDDSHWITLAATKRRLSPQALWSVNELCAVNSGRAVAHRRMQQTCNATGLSALSNLAGGAPVLCGCMLTHAENYDSRANVNDGSCVVIGCMDSAALDYDQAASVAGECLFRRVGCMIPFAVNYDALATEDSIPTACNFESPRDRSGCTDSTAVGFDPAARVDDGSCLPNVLGCRDPFASNYNSKATISSGCEYNVDGCTDSSAANYSPFAAVDDGSCRPRLAGCTLQGTPPFLAVNFDPEATVYSPGSCDFQRVGCRESAAVNYDALATYDGDCITAISGCTDPLASNFNSLATVLVPDTCQYRVQGCTDSHAANYASDAVLDDGSCTRPGCTASAASNFDSVATFDDGSCDLVSGCTNSRADNFRSDARHDDGSCVIGGCRNPAHREYDPMATVDMGCTPLPAGCTDRAASNYRSSAVLDDGSCRIAGCLDTAARNFVARAAFDDGSCLYGSRCDDPRATNFLSASDVGTGPCIFPGCTDSTRSNYDPLANSDDGSCEARERGGCTSTAAANHNPGAVVDDGSCIFLGCTLSWSSVYNPLANRADGSCPPVRGCPNSKATNYRSSANVDDSSCVILGCTDSIRPGYDPDATANDGSCGQLVYGCRHSTAENFMAIANAGGAELCAWRGCMDSHAINYDPTATVHDFRCQPHRPGCTQPAARNYAPSATEDDGSCYIRGCTNSLASNFNISATTDDGTCNAVILGCMDSEADNYNSLAVAANPTDDCSYVDCGGTALSGTVHPAAGGCLYRPLPPSPPFPSAIVRYRPPPAATPLPPLPITVQPGLTASLPMELEKYVSLWLLVLLIGFPIVSWVLYFKCYRKHHLSELCGRSYFLRPLVWASTRKSGKISSHCRLELRSSSTARRAMRVRAASPYGGKPQPQATTPAAAAESASLDVRYAHNVPRRQESADDELRPPAVPTPMVSSARVIDLSNATESLLRGDGGSPRALAPAPTGAFEPEYALNASQQAVIRPGHMIVEPMTPPRGPRASGPLGGLSAVEEEHTWGHPASSQNTWSDMADTDAGRCRDLSPDVPRREVLDPSAFVPGPEIATQMFRI